MEHHFVVWTVDAPHCVSAVAAGGAVRDRLLAALKDSLNRAASLGGVRRLVELHAEVVRGKPMDVKLDHDRQYLPEFLANLRLRSNQDK